MKHITHYLLPLLVVFSMLLTACGGGTATQPPAATEAPATEAPAATEMPATEAPTEAPGATEAPATEAPAGTVACPEGVDGTTIELTAQDSQFPYILAFPSAGLVPGKTPFKNLSKETFRRFLRQATTTEEVMTLLEEADNQQLA